MNFSTSKATSGAKVDLRHPSAGSTHDAPYQFRQAMAAHGLLAPDHIEAGRYVRFPGSGKGPRNKAAWCMLYEDLRGGTFGDFSTGLKRSWQARSEVPYTPAEHEANRKRVEAAKAQYETQVLATQALAREEAQALWAQGAPAPDSHPYLMKKGVKAHRLKCLDGALLVPMHDTAGVLHSLQLVYASDKKRNVKGGKKEGCFHLLGSNPVHTVIVAEGYSTAASLFEATGMPTVCAFGTGNLKAVAVALRAKYPAVQIILAADDDHLTPGNPGLTAATEAAQAVVGLVALPKFHVGRAEDATDFNDLHQLAGLEAVRAGVEAASPCAPPAGDEWAEPTPLPNALPDVMAFDAAFLPLTLRSWVSDIAHRMQCPVDYPAVAALVAASSLIGARAVVQPKAKDDWQVVPNLWGAVVGRPGVKKSPAIGEALRPLNRLQSTEMERWEIEHESWALDCKVLKLRDEANQTTAKKLAGKDPAAARALLAPGDTPTEPMARRFIVNDATVEKLGELLQQNPWGTLSYRDELYGLLTSLDKQGQEGARAFMLQSYDGNQGYTFDRIGRGTTHIPRVCLAMIGGIQPGRIQEYVRGAVEGGGADDGLLQRFGLAVWPDVKGEFVHVDQWPDTPARQDAWAVFERLAQLQPASDTEPVVWRFSEAAQALFVEWLVPFEIELRGDDLHPAMVSHLAKYRKLVPALALVFALIDTPNSGGVIGEAELLRALAMSNYLRTHAKRLYAAAETPETTDAAALLAKIKKGKLVDRDGVILESFTPRTVAVKGWEGLSESAAVRKAAEVLVDYGYLKSEVVPPSSTGGRPSERYVINPLLKGA